MLPALSGDPLVLTPSAAGTIPPAKATSDFEVDMWDSDNDSDMSWVDVPTAEPELTANTQSPNNAVAPPASDSKWARTGVKRRSSSSDSEWDFC
jgi:hypothetical protein